jgi:hypothetical protein
MRHIHFQTVQGVFNGILQVNPGDEVGLLPAIVNGPVVNEFTA